MARCINVDLSIIRQRVDERLFASGPSDINEVHDAPSPALDGTPLFGKTAITRISVIFPSRAFPNYFHRAVFTVSSAQSYLPNESADLTLTGNAWLPTLAVI